MDFMYLQFYVDSSNINFLFWKNMNLFFIYLIIMLINFYFLRVMQFCVGIMFCKVLRIFSRVLLV